MLSFPAARMLSGGNIPTENCNFFPRCVIITSRISKKAKLLRASENIGCRTALPLWFSA